MLARIVQILYTFFFYSIVCGMTVFFASKANKAKSKFYFWVYSVLTVLVPSVFAGLRGLNVGTDIKVYAYQTFQKANASSSLINFLATTSVEAGYSILAYFCSYIFSSIHVFLGATALMQVIPIYICAIKLKEKVNIKWTLFVFMMTYYVVGFNIMRQSIAAAWILLTYLLLEEKKYMKAVLCIVVAVLFHGTALLGVMFLALAFLFNKIKDKKARAITCIIFFIVFIYLMKYWEIIITLFGQLGVFTNDKVQGYSTIFSKHNSSLHFYKLSLSHYVEAIFKAALLIPFLLYGKKLKDSYLYTASLIYLIGLLVYLYFFIFEHTSYGYRITVFAEYFIILLLPPLMQKNSLKPNLGRGILVSKCRLLTFSILFMNWFILFVILQTHGTYPFKFFFE